MLRGTATSRAIEKVVASVTTQFASDATGVASGSCELIVDGSSVTGKVNGSTILNGTDGSPQLTTVFTGGVHIFARNDATAVTVDNHTIADVVAGRVPTRGVKRPQFYSRRRIT
jgi:hypothetical protein